MLSVLAAAALFLAPAETPTPSEPAAAPAKAPPADAAKAEKDPVICRYEAPLGTRLPKKVCANKSVRDAAARLAREDAEAVQRNGRGPFDTDPSRR